jgi:putative transcriptional regulator
MERFGLIQEVEKVLKENNYEIAEIDSSCFNILAKKDELLGIKVLENIDSITEQQAHDMRAFSAFLGCISFLIGIRDFRGPICDRVIYKRYGVPAANLRTFKLLLENSNEVNTLIDRGGKYLKINSRVLEEKRLERHYTRKALAQKINVSLRTIYNYEKNQLATFQNAMKLEKLFNSVLDSFTLKDFKNSKFEPVIKSFISTKLFSIGLECSDFKKTPFNTAAKDQQDLYFIKESNESSKLEKLKVLRDFVEKTALLIVEKKFESDFPQITKQEFSRIRSKRHFKKAFE